MNYLFECFEVLVFVHMEIYTSFFLHNPKTFIARVKSHRLVMAPNRIGAFFIHSFPFLFSRPKLSRPRAILHFLSIGFNRVEGEEIPSPPTRSNWVEGEGFSSLSTRPIQVDWEGKCLSSYSVKPSRGEASSSLSTQSNRVEWEGKPLSSHSIKPSRGRGIFLYF